VYRTVALGSFAN